MSATDFLIKIEGLTKTFGENTALDRLNLTVKKGEVHGFLGPNGSGKSTTIRILLGLLHKTDGSASLFGRDPWEDAVELHKRLAYVPGDVSFWPDLTGGEIIDLLGDLRCGLDSKRRQSLLETFELDPRKKFRTYSKGNRQKVALVAALASDVDLYILDEPTSGLDPLMESLFQKEILNLKQPGKTILLSSHILAEVEALCDRITIIRGGKTVTSATLQELQKHHRLIMKVESDQELDGLVTIKGIHNLSRLGTTTTFEIDHHALQETIGILNGYPLHSLTSHPPTLENLFLSHYDTAEKEAE